MKTTPRKKRGTRSPKKTPAKLTRIPRQEPERDVIDMIPRILRIQRILVPVDFSASARKALHYAVSFARQFDAKITVLHVRPLPYYPAEMGGFPVGVAMDDEVAGKIGSRLDADARLIPAEMRDRTLVRVGSAFDEICKAARELQTDVIILATHGHTGFKHILLGSTAECVVRHAPCPVLIVREHEHEFA